MEIRASYLLVGAVVLALVAGLAAFSVWLVKGDIDRQVDPYEIAFAGSVTGLQQGSQVRYRGVPVGRVTDIRIDPEQVESVLVTIEVEHGTPIRQDTVATLEMQGITGIAYVQLRGGTQASPTLAAAEGQALPQIESRRSTLERLFESTPDLLVHSLGLVEQATRLLSDQNLQALTKSLQNIETLTTTLARHSDEVESVLAQASGAAERVGEVSGEVGALASDLRRLTAKVDAQLDDMGQEVDTTLSEAREAASSLKRTAGALEVLVGDIRQPLSDFGATGLYEFTQLVGETRQLIAALTRITKEFERDPAGFLIGSSRGGFEAESK
ncbi:MAG TPA: MlaD family protein [Geminicoccaceae bacterium]|nr:MlaD family protein [Geminicoccaceae bacterium]